MAEHCFYDTDLKMVAGSFYIPKKNNLKPLGEDSHFICADHNTIGVADGVGGWARRGVDAGEYARELMSNCVSSVQDTPTGAIINPKSILSEAFLNTEAKGSSTACILSLDGEFLHAANVGDSGFVVIRQGYIIYQSPLQQRRFNHPYQLGNSTHADCPDSAIELTVAVEQGDVIVTGSDGLFDNVFSNEIEDLVKLSMDEMSDMPEVLAWNIAQFALDRSLDTSASTPFARASKRAGLEHMGGKYDDITVIVAYVV